MLARVRLAKFVAVMTVAAVAAVGGSAASAANAASLPEPDANSTPIPDSGSVSVEASVPEDARNSELGDDWQTSNDLAWTVTGDSHALRVLVAEKAKGFEWRELASLSIPDMETDRWIGNACLTKDESTLAVVYAPRSFANREQLSSRGAFAALVNVDTGEVKRLDGGYSLAYFNPSCGVDDWASFSQFSDRGETRIVSVRGSQPADVVVVSSNSYVTSAITTGDGLFGAVAGGVARIDESGGITVTSSAQGTPYSLTTVGDGLAYVESLPGEQARAALMPNLDQPSDSLTVAEGGVADLDLSADTNDQLYVLGSPASVAENLPIPVVAVPGSSPGAEVSSGGGLVVEDAAAPTPSGASETSKIEVDTRSVTSGNELSFSLDVDAVGTAAAESARPDVGRSSLRGTREAAAGPRVESAVASQAVSANATDPAFSGSPCAVPRNDPGNQALQPRPAQVEYAVDQAVRGTLLGTRAANWMNLGMPQYQPQGLFAPPTLLGGGRVPASVMLGILAQESNLSQASVYTVPGVTGNPLIGNYYGINKASTAPGAWWNIDYSLADCGYGVGQVTDGMTSGAMPYQQQRAIALDFEANIARSLQILVDKWNTTRAAGLTINDGNAAYPENWFFALWAYNSGWHPQGAAGEPWGVGWFNNPANPIYPKFRGSFLDGRPADAAHPQDWPYSEKVLGFAANSVLLLDNVSSNGMKDTGNYVTAFAPAWWRSTDNENGAGNRRAVKPPIYTFCKASNDCNEVASYQPDVPGQPIGPCGHVGSTGYDLKCWFHTSATWKTDCASTCGYENLTYASNASGSARPASANSYPSNCSGAALPSGSIIIDNRPSTSPSVRGDCTNAATSGSFGFNFADDGTGRYPSRVDLQQLGSGFNGHFYFAHTRVPGTADAYSGKLDITGTWNLGQSLNQWAKVFVHMPSHGAWAQQARYSINTGMGVIQRSVSQRNYANQWVSLGVVQFNGVPSISLSSSSSYYAAGSGQEDIAWDAVAITPLSQKPSEIIVALGDSYSSGEGTSASDGSGFFRSSDNNGTGGYARNACHRSKEAWAYKMAVSSLGGATVRSLTENKDESRIDFQLLACSGAETPHVRSKTGPYSNSRFGEDNQLDRGFVDSNTTLVTLSIGGNDTYFAPIISSCTMALVGSSDCGANVDASVTPAGYPANASKRWSAVVDWNMPTVKNNVLSTLQEIHAKAPSAKILMLGYPKIFETYPSACAGVQATQANRDWLNSVATKLNQALTSAATTAGSYVVFQNPSYRFTGQGACTSSPAINGLMWNLTPGDAPLIEFNFPGPNLEVGPSAQSVHPNSTGTSLYADVANVANAFERTDVSSSIVGASGTTYYSTFRYHTGGPAAFNVRSFAACGGELRVGLRRSSNYPTDTAFGSQTTNSLSWLAPNDMQTFTRADNNSPDLQLGWYAMNVRLVGACAGGGSQPWSGSLFW